MATFNFEIKNQSYKIALENTKNYLMNDDIESGVYYLKLAIKISNELIQNCVILEVKNKLVIENKKLNQILNDILNNNHNPFSQKSSKNVEKSEESKNVFFSENPPKVNFKSVAGLEDVKEEIFLNVIAPIKYPDLYLKYKDKLGCQILLYGPPGCGKSFVAEAIAGELECAYALINSSDILDKYVGEAPKKIVQIFEESKKYDKCLIFFDELDALFADRENDDSRNTKDVLTTFLTCLSGFGSNSSNQVRIVIGATNRPWVLDSAVLRGKRFDTHIYVGLPDDAAREFLIKKYFNKHQSLLENTDVSIAFLTKAFDGYSSADIEAMIEKMSEAALKRAIKNKYNGIEKNEPITLNDVKSVMSNYRNSVSKESLEAFMAFKNGEY